MRRLFLIAACAAAATPAPGRGQAKPDPKAAENVKKAQAAVHATASGLDFLSKAAWAGAVLTGNPALKDMKRTVDSLNKPVKDLDDAVGRAARAVAPADKPKAAEGVRDKLKLLKMDGQVDALNAYAAKVAAVPVGLVSDALDDEFKVTPDLLATRPKDAERRFNKLLDAMRTNATQLRTVAQTLDDAATAAKAAGAVVGAVKAGIEKLAAAGVVTRPLVATYLDADRLQAAYNRLAADAAKKSAAAKKAAEEQDRRHDNLKSLVLGPLGFTTR